MKRFPWKVLTKKKDWLSGWPILILIQKAAMKSQLKNENCLSALMTSPSSLLNWKGGPFHSAILSSWYIDWPKIIGVSLLQKTTDKNELLTCLSCLRSYRAEVKSGKAKSWWRTSAKTRRMVKQLQFGCPLWSGDRLDWSKSSPTVPRQLPDKDTTYVVVTTASLTPCNITTQIIWLVNSLPDKFL